MVRFASVSHAVLHRHRPCTFFPVATSAHVLSFVGKKDQARRSDISLSGERLAVGWYALPCGSFLFLL